MAADRTVSGDCDRPTVHAGGARGVVVGDYSSQTNVFLHAGSPVRSAYLEQVRRIAPTVLIDRERDLAELVDFCVGEDRGPYLWWRAPAWAGKSALMSWFVLHPPPGVRVVSFFVTASLPGQDERRAFVDNVLEQLAALLGQVSTPPYLSDATRDVHLLAMLTEATNICRERGQRLVLVVDGLDEDRGVQLGPDMHSIAALLPARPPAGLRIVVTGRPAPIPSDVGDGHPLRQLEIVRSLEVSPHAAVVRVDAEREVTRLSHGSLMEQDLLGLLTVTGGGLSGRDLAELTSQDQRQVDDLLDTVAGRTVSRRPARWQPEITPEVYALGHIGLQPIAERLVGAARLNGCRQRVHAWADRYRDRGWPAGTPEYLLGGYFRILHESGDLPRMIAYASDDARHDRMLYHTGGDGAALEEVAAAQDGILGQSEPDLVAMCDLAVHRDGLLQRNGNIPVRLPAVWATLGRVGRAEALVQSINTDGGTRAVAQALLARAVATTGELDRAQTLARTLPEHTFIVNNLQAETLCTLTTTVAAAGDYRRADALADSIRDPYRQAQARGEIALAIAKAGDLDQAQARARLVAEPYWQAQALGVLARRATKAGRDDLAATLTAQADAQAAAVTDVDRRALAVGYLARLAAEDGDQHRTAALVIHADGLLRSVTDAQRRAATATTLASFAAAAGDPRLGALLGQAEVAARAIPDPYHQAAALAAIVTAIAQVGDHDRAEALARSITDEAQQAAALADLAATLAAAGDHDRAEALARSLGDPQQQGRALTALAKELATLGDYRRAEAVARSVTDPRRQAAAVTEVAAALADSPNRHHAELLAEQAETMARSIVEPSQRAKTLIEMTSVLAAIGQRDRAMVLAAQAEAVAAGITGPWEQRQIYTKLISAALAVDDYDRAEAAVNAVTDPKDRAALLTQVISALLTAGQRGRAMAVAEQAESAARSITNVNQQTTTVTRLASLLAEAGEYDRATALARCLDARYQGEVLTYVAQSAAVRGEYDRAVALASCLDERNRWVALGHVARAAAAAGDYERAEAVAGLIGSTYQQAKVLADLASILAGAGDHDRAEAITRSISDERQRVQAVIALAQNSDQPRARALVAWALRNGTWSEPLTALARVQPDAVLVAADRLIQNALQFPDRNDA